MRLTVVSLQQQKALSEKNWFQQCESCVSYQMSTEFKIAFSGGFPDGSGDKESSCNSGAARDACLIPGSERSSREGNSNPLQYSCLENPMDRGAWKDTVHRVAKSRTRLK